MEQTKALIVIDEQASAQWLANHLFKQVFPGSFGELLKRNQGMVNRFIANNQPVIIVTTRPTILPKTLQNCFARTLIKTTTSKNIFSVVKTTPDTFEKTNLLAVLKQLHVTEILVSGCTINNTVTKTVATAIKHGLKATVVADACIASSEAVWQTATNKFEHVATTVQIVSDK